MEPNAEPNSWFESIEISPKGWLKFGFMSERVGTFGTFSCAQDLDDGRQRGRV